MEVGRINSLKLTSLEFTRCNAALIPPAAGLVNFDWIDGDEGRWKDPPRNGIEFN